jgi:hypothetical protein
MYKQEVMSVKDFFPAFLEIGEKFKKGSDYYTSSIEAIDRELNSHDGAVEKSWLFKLQPYETQLAEYRKADFDLKVWIIKQCNIITQPGNLWWIFLCRNILIIFLRKLPGERFQPIRL